MKRIAYIVLFVLTSFAFASIVGLRIIAESKSRLRPHAASVMLRDSDGVFLADYPNNHGKLGYWPIRGLLSKHLIDALLSAEDKDFFKHGGVNYKAAFRALWQNITSLKRVSGASTLAMQVVRMDYPSPRNWPDKLTEAFAARLMIRRYGHAKILRHYLTIAPFGPRIHGIRYAAAAYFDKPVGDLSLAQIALLIAVPKSPVSLNLFRKKGFERAKKRALWILKKMLENHYITKYRYAVTKKSLNEIPRPLKHTRPESALHAILRLRKKLHRRFTNPEITVSIELLLQNKFQKILKNYVKKRRKYGLENAALIVLDRKTGRVLCYIGSENYYDKKHKGAINYCSVRRSSGSTLKPFLYTLGMIKNHFTSATILSDVGITLAWSGGIYSPENADYQFQGPVLYRYALANSRNIPAVELVRKIGLYSSYEYLESIGLVEDAKMADYYGLSIAIGGLYVSLEQLMRAYLMLANRGMDIGLNWGVEKKAAVKRRMPADIAQMIALYLSDPVARVPAFPRKSPLEYPFPVAIKTGTSQGYRDAWAVAFSEKYVVGVWSGNAENKPMREMSGSISSAVLVKKIFKILEPVEMSGQRALTFPPPKGYISRNISLIDGRLSDRMPYVSEWFRPGTEPKIQSRVYSVVKIDKRNGRLADENTAPEYLCEKKVLSLSPKYMQWAMQLGLPVAPEQNTLAEKQATVKKRIMRVLSPPDGLTYLIDPNEDRHHQSIALKADINPPVRQIVWYVDGEPYMLADYPYTVRWYLSPGVHKIKFKAVYMPLESDEVTIRVK